LIFVNVSDESQEAQLEFDAGEYGLQSSQFLLVSARTESGAAKAAREGKRFERRIKLKPQGALALEISPAT